MLKTLVYTFLILSLLSNALVIAAEGAGFDEEILVVAPTPVGGVGVDANKLPFTVQTADADAFERAQAIDLTDYLGTHLGSVSINSAQSNPLQPDVQYRGYAASPLLGLSQGIAVFQNGVRINEPFGDAVNWDLLPQSAVHQISLVGGSNPLFGLNALGGALSIEMKNGFNFDGVQAQVSGGAWQRITTSVESGGNNGTLGYYVNASYFEEGGWRDLSDSDALNIFATASYRDERSALDLGAQYGDSDLRGNGASPLGLLQIDRGAVFTAPDITDNDMAMFTLRGEHEFNGTVSANLTGFYRQNETHSFNGDASDLIACELVNGTFLIEGFDDDALDGLGFDDDDVCVDNALVAADPDGLEAALNAQLAPAVELFNLDDLTGSLSGTSVLADQAINNRSTRDQKSYGGDIQFTFRNDVFDRGNYFVAGFGYFKGMALFDSVTELSNIDPLTRSTQGLGVGTFIDEEATNVRTSSETWSVYFTDSIDVSERLTFTLGGRYNTTAVELRDRSGVRAELSGKHRFSRFNPTVGATLDVADYANVYVSYSESSRAPTPIELACNEGVFAIARANAIAAGEDPDDIDFECRLPNAFLADPPLEQIVAKTIEFGVRGDIGSVRHRLGYFHTDNNNDIIFQTTGRGRGLFANVLRKLDVKGLSQPSSGS